MKTSSALPNYISENTPAPRYHNETLQAKWEAAVNYLRTQSQTGWVLDKRQSKIDKKAKP